MQAPPVGVVRGKNSNRWTLSTCLVRLSPVVLSAHSWRFDITANDDAITLFATIHNNFSRLAPDLNVYCIVDVVASFYPCLP
jgi:hypothetical protein